ncbi:hypothetical protein IFM89_024595 [Coptis chinensis]|uniref:BRCT domain-containing protein n=1 Tax=Coptis chinensis TaxID=261450 RepID=A0A835M0X8_9MAGN|nr:hypothetical protein IFM89_024595 [Coptis chinensis]
MADPAGKRNLPSWMASRDNNKTATRSRDTRADTLSFSKLLDGVVFVLSGFVNPERSTLRSQAQEMGGEYQTDWNSNCTLLISAFPNTPKFRQVEADCGTIVSKEWIAECYSQKKLVAIEKYLMHPGKPWRKCSISHEAFSDDETITQERPHTRVERNPLSKPSASSSSKGGAPSHIKKSLSPTEVKKWAIKDLNETVSWLESQEESPEPAEVKKIAAEGILTCLQDAIDSLHKNQEIRQVTEQWKFIPHVVKELARLEDMKSSKRSGTDKDIYEQALTCKRLYEKEYDNLDDDSIAKKKGPAAHIGDKDIMKVHTEPTEAEYDSDETIEMTEDEIDLAYESIISKLCKWYVTV